MDMTIKLQVFEGPLDLLLYLIEKNKVNIYEYITPTNKTACTNNPTLFIVLFFI